VERPACDIAGHEGSKVVRAGWYGSDTQRRQRWLCTPANGERHRFAENLPRIVAGGRAAHACDECATTLEPWEGQPAPRMYGFSARHVAYALAQVAAGATYRSTAAAVRTAAGRELDTKPRQTSGGKPLAPPNNHGQLVSDWVEVFAPVVWAAHAPQQWPDKLLIDEDQFRYRQLGMSRGVHAFYVFGAVGYTSDGRPYVAAVEAFAKTNIPAWTAFLGSLAGQPTRIVADGGLPATAASRLWPRPTTDVRRCEWHLARNLSEALPADVRSDEFDSIHTLLAGAVRSTEGWDAFGAEVMRRAQDGSYLNAVASVNRLDTIVRQHTASRPDDGPHSTGPLEQFFRTLETTIGDRAARMTNKPRADALLNLLAAHRNGWVDEKRWAELIRDHLERQRGVAPQQRQHTDAKTAPSLR
jgi:hypothetical protein